VTDSYFQRVAANTPTRLWINNPTAVEIGAGLAQGAVGCTTNPSYAASLLKREPEYVRGVIAASVAALPGADDARVAENVQQRLVARIAERFADMHERSGGRAGYVSIQGSPLEDHDADAILRAGRAAVHIAPNAAVKVPATAPGLLALEQLVEDGSPTIVTEVFSVAQLIEANERYLKVTGRTAKRPSFFMSPITGILGDHLRKVAVRDAIAADPRALQLAGVALARRCYGVVVERAYPVTLLFGGARSIDDFTGLVGGPTASTINYSTVEEILALDPPVEMTIDEPMAAGVVEHLLAKFPDLRQAWGDVPLTVEDFEEFGPVQHFRGSFVGAWEAMLAAIRETRVGAETTAS
jgi:transaldolase